MAGFNPGTDRLRIAATISRRLVYTGGIAEHAWVGEPKSAPKTRFVGALSGPPPRAPSLFGGGVAVQGAGTIRGAFMGGYAGAVTFVSDSGARINTSTRWLSSFLVAFTRESSRAPRASAAFVRHYPLLSEFPVPGVTPTHPAVKLPDGRR
ncbi:hypothetical protein LSTR_LSTR015413 [Laodelphax striatellus]|uniref:Uncharacterized protein n=1 Tax=Laodelphax striatellus TaxID=195883 RepID=A0A482WQL7_LAOST|nr:hypothetical protein LSTR_LSTR015413 [Laodelphax striatellus]